MAVIEISLPEELALSAKDAGLLSDRAIQGSCGTRSGGGQGKACWRLLWIYRLPR